MTMTIGQLKQYLDDNKNATSLNLGGQGITNEGAVLIGKFIEANKTTITHLYLYNNQIGDEVAKALAKGDRGNQITNGLLLAATRSALN